MSIYFKKDLGLPKQLYLIKSILKVTLEEFLVLLTTRILKTKKKKSENIFSKDDWQVLHNLKNDKHSVLQQTDKEGRQKYED